VIEDLSKLPHSRTVGHPISGGREMPEKEWKCQFCEKVSSPKDWKNGECPFCHQRYNWLEAQETEED